MTIKTWADGFGRWHALVPSTWDQGAAWEAIRQELIDRDESPIAIEEALWVEHVESTTQGTIFREAWAWDED